jgi:twitching motility protein PilU
VRSKDNKRVAAVEVLLNTPHIQELIKKGDVIGVKEALRTTTERGMQNFDAALYQLVKQGRIDLEEALNNADSRHNLEARINFG